uniref:HVA22-like protein n=1 Tax=Leersia perrieri TaxID=77586 RepID=A0A0D9VBH8_9ORYZ
MVVSFVTRALILILGYAYPAYDCYKTVELNRPEVAQLRFWCQYWILLAVLTVFERVGDNFVSWCLQFGRKTFMLADDDFFFPYRLPMYSEAKLAFIVYLWYPKTQRFQGTSYVYESFFKPYIGKHEAEIDRNLLELRTRAGDMAVHYFQKIADYSQTRFYEILQYIASQSETQRSRSQYTDNDKGSTPIIAVDWCMIEFEAQQNQQRPPPPRTRQVNPGPPPVPSPSAPPLPPQPAQPPPPRTQVQADKAPIPVPPPGAATESPAEPQPPQPGPESVTTATNAGETQAAIPPAVSSANHSAAPVIPDEETLIQEAIRMTRSRLRRRMGGAA